MDLIEQGRPSYLISANVHYAMLTSETPELRAINDRASLVLADGSPLIWASRRGPVPLPERVAGSDLIYDLCERLARLGRSIYFLGGAEGVAEEAARKLQARYPGLKIAGTACPSPETMAGEGCQQVIADVKAAKPDLLMLALSQPKGEFWMVKHFAEIGAPVTAQFGATLDFVAGRVPRAPLWVQKIGMEWAYRITTDPARLFPRYVKNALFLFGRVVRDLAGLDKAAGPKLMADPSPTPRTGESTS
jgi:N-acetylglucosaminyldiphosphoundecaprenol N-acetyl-beta-D-mannosaminyltransferase